MTADQETELTEDLEGDDQALTPWYARPEDVDPEMFARHVHLVSGPAGLRTVLKLCQGPEAPSEARRYVPALRDRLRTLEAQGPVQGRTTASPGVASEAGSE